MFINIHKNAQIYIVMKTLARTENMQLRHSSTICQVFLEPFDINIAFFIKFNYAPLHRTVSHSQGVLV